ncbi:hyalin-like [Antedon mediterranea]|uniref:hyalin-like n=1 Tax=Antedon mediterranea TaxID=105859 RepID=UPI003AF80D34
MALLEDGRLSDNRESWNHTQYLESPDFINCPMNMTVNTTTGEAFAINVTWVEPRATDNSGETAVPVADYTSGDNMFPIGDTTVQYNYNEDPIIKKCPNDTTVNTTNGLPTANVSWIEPTATDNSGTRFFINIITSGSIFQIGDSLVIYTAFDYPKINTAICSFIVTVEEDNRLVGVSTDEGSPNATVTWDPPLASDNSNATVTVVSSPFESGDMISIGTHTITFTATDSSGNFDTCEFNIKIEDQEAPDIINCPMDMTVNTATGEAFAINVTWVEPTATDNSGEII